MSLRPVLMMAGLLATGAVLAQTAPAAKLPPGSDSWGHAPARASSAPGAYADAPRTDRTQAASHFQFKTSEPAHPMRNEALEQSGKAPVMGGAQLGRDGRPTVSCVSTPMDPACR